MDSTLSVTRPRNDHLVSTTGRMMTVYMVVIIIIIISCSLADYCLSLLPSYIESCESREQCCNIHRCVYQPVWFSRPVLGKMDILDETSTLLFSQLIPFPARPFGLIPLRQPTLDPFDLPLVGRPYEVRFTTDVQDARRIPVVTGTRDEHLVLSVPTAGVVSVVANVPPDVTATVDQGESRSRNVEISVHVIPSQVGPVRRRYGLRRQRSLGEGPSAPLLGVIEVDGP